MDNIQNNSVQPKQIVFLLGDSDANIYKAIEQCSRRVLSMQSIEELLERVTQVQPDIILLDLKISGRRILDACSRLKADSKTQNIPVILLNVPADKQGVQDAFEAGVDDYITSPILTDEVVIRIATQLELQSLRCNLKKLDDGLVGKYEYETGNRQLQDDLKACRCKLDDLVNSEQLFRMLTEESPDYITYYDRHCRKTYINPNVEQILGICAHELIGLTPIEIRPGDPQFVAYQEKIQEVLDTGQTSDYEFVFVDKTGGLCYHNVRFVAVYAEKQVIAVIAIGRDVTELRSIQWENALLGAIAENSSDLMIIAHTLDTDNGLPLVYYNPSAARHLGYNDDEMSRLCVGDFTDYDPKELAAHMNLLRSKNSIRIETEHIRSDGSRVPVEAMLSILVHNGEELAVGYCLDISKRKVAEKHAIENEQVLRNSERQFRTLAENTPDNVVRYDHNCRVIYANPQVEKLMAQSFGPIIGATPAEHSNSLVDFNDYQDVLERVIATGEPDSIELEIRFLEKATQIHQINMVAERRPNGEVRGALAIGRDVTALKETEKHLEESHAKLRALTQRRESAQEEERKHIARELHDDLGQYLTALNLQATALQIGFGDKDVTLGGMIEQIIALIDGMKTSVRNLSQRLRPEALSMGLNAALQSLATNILFHGGIDYSIELYENVDEIGDAETAVVYRVTQESLNNIVQYAEAQYVEISLDQRYDQFVLIISDDGKGFDITEVKPTSFGLIGMRERLESIGGALEIESEPQTGTTIIARFPAT